MSFANRDNRDLPRLINPDLLWTGGCMELTFNGENVHSHFGIFVVRGSQKTMLIDSGHPVHSEAIERALDEFLGDRPLDFIFPTHGEFPHAGLIPRWLAKYPDLKIIGDLRDYDLYYPEEVHRFVNVKVGDSIDLGDRSILFVPAVWRDLPNTLWAFDTKDRALFVADGFSFMHYHHPGECGMTTGEQPPPDMKMIQIFNQLALQWTKYSDPRPTFADIDALFGMLKPKIIASAHGAVIDTPDQVTPMIKQGMTT